MRPMSALEKIADDRGQQIFQLECHVSHFRRMCEQGVLPARAPLIQSGQNSHT